MPIYNSEPILPQKYLPTCLVGASGTYAKFRNLAHQLKRSDSYSIKQASSKMELAIKALPNYSNGILVPIPSHVGHATYTLEIAKELSSKLDIPVADIIKCAPRDMLYTNKKLGNSINQVDLKFFTDGVLPSGKIPILVDNVLDTGKTLSSSLMALNNDKSMAIVLAHTKNYSQNTENHFLVLKFQKDISWNYKRIQMDILNRLQPLDAGILPKYKLNDIKNYSDFQREEKLDTSAQLIDGIPSFSDNKLSNTIRVYATEPITDGVTVYTDSSYIPLSNDKEIYSQFIFVDDVVWSSKESGIAALITERYKFNKEKEQFIPSKMPVANVEHTHIINTKTMEKENYENFIGRTYIDASSEVGDILTINKILKGEHGAPNRFELSGIHSNEEEFSANENADQFIARIREGKSIPVVGKITFYNSSDAYYSSFYTDKDRYLTDVKESLDYGETIKHNPLSKDPSFRKAIMDIESNLFGMKNPHDLDYYEDEFGEEYKMEKLANRLLAFEKYENLIGLTYKDASSEAGDILTINKLLKGEHGAPNRFELSGTHSNGEEFSANENADQFIARIQEGKSIPVVGKITFYNSPDAYYSSLYTDKDEYTKAIKEAWDTNKEISCNTLSKDPSLWNSVRDLNLQHYGVDNSKELKYYRNFIGRTYIDASSEVGDILTINKILKGEHGAPNRFELSGIHSNEEEFSANENADQFIARIREGKSIPVVGKITFYNSPDAYYSSFYTDKDEYTKAIKEAWDANKEISCNTLSKDPSLWNSVSNLEDQHRGFGIHDYLDYYEDELGEEYKREKLANRQLSLEEIDDMHKHKEQSEKSPAVALPHKEETYDVNKELTPQASLLLSALNTAQNHEDAIFVNEKFKSAPSFFGKNSLISPFNSLLMAIHSDTNQYATNQYITFQTAKDNKINIQGHAKSAPYNWVAWDTYINSFDHNQKINKEQFNLLSPEEKELFKLTPRLETRPIFNIDQTILSYYDREKYESLVKEIGARHELTPQHEAFLDTFEKAKSSYKDATLLFRDSKEYYAFNEDAETLAAFVGKSPEKFNNLDNVKSVSFPQTSLDVILPRLIHSGHRVALLDMKNPSELEIDKAIRPPYTKFVSSIDTYLVPVKNHPLGSGNITEYDHSTDQINRGLASSFSSDAHDFVKAVMASTGSPERLNRNTHNVISPEDALRHEELVQELASAAKLVQMGLSSRISSQNIKHINYWKREIAEDPNLMKRLEREVNIAVKVVNDRQQGLDVNFQKLRGEQSNEVKMPNDYSISRGLTKYPDIESKEFLIVRDNSLSKADIILPVGASLDIHNEVPQMSKQRIAIALQKEGISQENIKFYNAGGALGYYKPDREFTGDTISLNKLKQYSLVEQGRIDLTEALSRSQKNLVPIEKTSMLKDNAGTWVLYIKPKVGKSVVVIPSKEDTNKYFSSLKQPEGSTTRQSLGQKYIALLKQHSNLQSDILNIDTSGLDLSRINKVNVFKTRDNEILLSAVIDGKHQPYQKVSKAQWDRMWIADNINAYKSQLAGSIFREHLSKTITSGPTPRDSNSTPTEDKSNENETSEEIHRGFHM